MSHKYLSTQKTVDAFPGLTWWQRQQLFWLDKMDILDPSRRITEAEFGANIQSTDKYTDLNGHHLKPTTYE